MPLTLAKIAARQATVTFTYEGEEVHVTYRPEVLSAHYRARMDAVRALADEDTAKHEVDGMVLELVSAWDVLTEEGGPPIPLTLEALFPLSPYFEAYTIMECFKDAGLGEPRGVRPSVPSASPSLPAAPQATSRRRRRTGTR